MRMLQLVRLVGAALLLFVLTLGTAHANRVALVIGASEYANAGDLPNARNDAQDMANSLRMLGFDSVDLLMNPTKPQFESALLSFRPKADSAEAAVIFYAGHGMGIDGESRLIPVESRLAHQNDVELETIPLSTLTSTVRGASRLQLVILDACRDNPLGNRMARPAGGTRSIARGLAPVEPSGDTLVWYAARDGSTAADGDGRNSPFTAALLQHIQSPGLEIDKLFRHVVASVKQSTNYGQEPFSYGSRGIQDFFFIPSSPSADTQVAMAPPDPCGPIIVPDGFVCKVQPDGRPGIYASPSPSPAPPIVEGPSEPKGPEDPPRSAGSSEEDLVRMALVRAQDQIARGALGPAEQQYIRAIQFHAARGLSIAPSALDSVAPHLGNRSVNFDFRTLFQLSQLLNEDPSARVDLLTPEDIQSKLRDNEVFVSLVSLGSGNVLSMITRGSIVARFNPVTRSTFDQVDQAFVDLLTPVGEVYRDFDPTLGHKAFQLLFGDLGPKIGTYPHIIFSPQGALGNVPLEMLVTQAPNLAESAPWRQGNYTRVPFVSSWSAVSYVSAPRRFIDIASGQSRGVGGVQRTSAIRAGMRNPETSAPYRWVQPPVVDTFAISR